MDPTDYLKFFAALVFVLSLMGGLAFVLKRMGLDRAGLTGRGNKRLGVEEILPLDARRKLVMIRRDDVRHLVILGPSGETVVEMGIPATDDIKKE